jgi:hypothetical protein
MKTYFLLLTALTIGCASALAVSDEDFQKMQQQMQQQSQQIQDLQKAHQEDQQEIQQLKEQQGITQKTTTETQQKAEAAQKKAEEAQQTATSAEASAKAPVATGPDALQNFTIVGDAEFQFAKTEGQHSAFVLADFAPIFLFRATDKVLFEAGFDVILQNGSNPAGTHDSGSGNSVSLSFGTLDYLFNDYVTVVAGDMLLPLGTYSERSAGWLNKIPDAPLPRGVLPGAGVGLQLRGAMPVGDSGQAVTYAVYGVNGPGSSDGSATSSQLDLGGNVGLTAGGNTMNLHGSPSAGGRVGWFFPWQPHWDAELGVSGQAGTWNDMDNKLWSASVFDGALHLSPNIEIKGEYIYTWVESTDRGTFIPRGWWVQAGYKLAGLELDFPMINSLELVGRYDTINDGLGTWTDRYTAGWVYYITNTLWLEGDYEWVHSSDPSQANNNLIVQLSYGF